MKKGYTKKIIYTISTIELDSLEEVKEYLKQWVDAGILKENTKIFKVSSEIPFEVVTEIKI